MPFDLLTPGRLERVWADNERPVEAALDNLLSNRVDQLLALPKTLLIKQGCRPALTEKSRSFLLVRKSVGGPLMCTHGHHPKGSSQERAAGTRAARPPNPGVQGLDPRCRRPSAGRRGTTYRQHP